MYRKYRTKTRGRLVLYLSENLPGKIINSHKFKKNSETIFFESSVSSKKWLLLGNYKSLLQNDLSFINECTPLVTNDVMYNLTSKRGGTWRFKTCDAMRCIARSKK